MGFTVIIICLTLFYAAVISVLFVGLSRLRTATTSQQLPVSVIIAARNEEHNIRKCLDALIDQQYPKELFEVVVVDDRSSDATADIVESFQEQVHNIKLIRILTSPSSMPPKKYALTRGIEASANDILLFTDADCIPPENWVSGMMNYFGDDVGVVAGYSPYVRNRGWLATFAQYENLKSAIGAAGSIGIGKAYMCVGRNLAYRKKVFQEVNGFETAKHSISGDDDLFLHTVRKRTTWKICYAISPPTFVPTNAPQNLKEYLNQKKRHFSAGAYYSRSSQVVLFFFHLANALLLMSAIASIFWFSTYKIGLDFFLLKLLLDFVLLNRGSAVFKQRQLVKYFVPLEVMYILYDSIVGPLGLLRKFTWKP